MTCFSNSSVATTSKSKSAGWRNSFVTIYQQKSIRTLENHAISPEFSKSFANSSRLVTWGATFCNVWLKLIRYFVTQANRKGFDATLQEEIRRYEERMDVIRSMATDRFHMLVRTYTYLRQRHP